MYFNFQNRDFQINYAEKYNLRAELLINGVEQKRYRLELQGLLQIV